MAAAAKVIPKKEQARGWVFTINNPDPHESIIFVDGIPEQVRYIVYQREKGAEGTEHLQGYVQFTKPRLRTWIVKFLYNERMPFARAHLEIARGTPEQNKAYCTKMDTRVDGPWEMGKPSKSGDRNDLTAVFDKLKIDGDVRSVPGDVMIKYGSNVLKVGALCRAPWRPNLRVLTFIGKTGVGKSWQTHTRFPDVFMPYYGNSGLWWDGYIDQSTILLEEFRGQIQLSKLLQILDPYPLHVEVKGGCMAARYSTVIITSNSAPEFWYKNEDGSREPDLQALYRRLGYSREFRDDTRYITADSREELEMKLNAARIGDPQVYPDRQGHPAPASDAPAPAPAPPAAPAPPTAAVMDEETLPDAQDPDLLSLDPPPLKRTKAFVDLTKDP